MTDSPSIEALITQCHFARFRVLNLFETSGGRWQANLTDDASQSDPSLQSAFEFGHGTSAREALGEALSNALRGNGKIAVRQHSATAFAEKHSEASAGPQVTVRKAEDLGL